MGTELLVRRMDLIHSMQGITNVLTMDTTYPVKLSGIVNKLYISTYDVQSSIYTNDDDVTFIIRNQNNEELVKITKNNTLEFSGNPLTRYPYKDEYVMVIIDIDNARIYICSQSMFSDLFGSMRDDITFERLINNYDRMSVSVNSDAIVDMASFDPTTYYGDAKSELYGANKPIAIDELIVNKGYGALLTILQNTPNLPPALYGALLNPRGNKNANIAPIDTVAPGTIKLYNGESYINRAIEHEKNTFNNYSLIRDGSHVIHQLLSDTTNEKGYIPIPVSDTKVNTINKIRISSIPYFFLMPHNTGTENSNVNIIDSICWYRKISGFLTDQFRKDYGVEYGSDLYNEIMNPDTKNETESTSDDPHPIISTNGSNGIVLSYIYAIPEDERKDYYYILLGNYPTIDAACQQYSFIPVRCEDNYLDLNIKSNSMVICNKKTFNFNLQESSTDYIGTWWGSKGHQGNGVEWSPDGVYVFSDSIQVTYDNRGFYTLTNSIDSVEGISTVDPIIVDCKFNIDNIDLPDGNTDIFIQPTNFIENLNVNVVEKVYNGDAETTEYMSNYKFNLMDRDNVTQQIPITYTIKNRSNGVYYYKVPGVINKVFRITVYKVTYPEYNQYTTTEGVKSKTLENNNYYYLYKYETLELAHMSNNISVNASSNVVYQGQYPLKYLTNDNNLILLEENSFYTHKKENYHSYKDYYYEDSVGTKFKVRYFFETDPTLADDDQLDLLQKINKDYIIRTEVGTNYSDIVHTDAEYYNMSVNHVKLPYRLLYHTLFYNHPTIGECYKESTFYLEDSTAPLAPPEYNNNFSKWLKDIPCWMLFDNRYSDAISKINSINGGINLKYIFRNGVQSKSNTYSASEFFVFMATRDLHIDPDLDESYLKNSEASRTFERFIYRRDAIESISRKNHGITNDVDNNHKFIDPSGNYVTIESSITVKWSGNPRFFFNSTEVDLQEDGENGINYSANNNNRINVVNNISGVHQTSSISIVDENNQLLPLFGSEGAINTDNLKWFDLLLALNNNRSINILGPLQELKKQLGNEYGAEDSYGYFIRKSNGTITLIGVDDVLKDYLAPTTANKVIFQVNEDSTLYYLRDGVKAVGEIYIDGAPYSFTPDGVLNTGWQTVMGKTYYYDETDGNIHLGWVEDGAHTFGDDISVPKKYYITLPDGMYIDRIETINGKRYQFDYDGVSWEIIDNNYNSRAIVSDSTEDTFSLLYKAIEVDGKIYKAFPYNINDDVTKPTIYFAELNKILMGGPNGPYYDIRTTYLPSGNYMIAGFPYRITDVYGDTKGCILVTNGTKVFWNVFNKNYVYVPSHEQPLKLGFYRTSDNYFVYTSYTDGVLASQKRVLYISSSRFLLHGTDEEVSLDAGFYEFEFDVQGYVSEITRNPVDEPLPFFT